MQDISKYLNYKYLRIQGLELAAETNCAKGVFSMCWKLVQEGKIVYEDQYQVAVEVDGSIHIDPPQHGWT